MRALVLAGGQGTRLAPLTDTRPKPLVPFCGEPFAAGLLRRLAVAGCDRATFLIARDPEPFDILRPLGEELGIIVEATGEEQPLDTAGAVRRHLEGDHRAEPALVCNGDILTDLDFTSLVAAHEGAGAQATLALTRVADTSTFGVVVCDAQHHVERFVEKPPRGTVDADTVNAGTYVLGPDVFDRFPGDGPLSFERQVFPGLLEAGARLYGVVSDAFWADLGTPDRYLDGTQAVLEGRCRWPIPDRMGRTEDGGLVDANAVVDGATVTAGSVVHDGCVVSAGAVVDGSVLFPEAHIGAGAIVTRSILGAGATVAAGVRVGPGAVVGDGAGVE